MGLNPINFSSNNNLASIQVENTEDLKSLDSSKENQEKKVENIEDEFINSSIGTDKSEKSTSKAEEAFIEAGAKQFRNIGNTIRNMGESLSDLFIDTQPQIPLGADVNFEDIGFTATPSSEITVLPETNRSIKKQVIESQNGADSDDVIYTRPLAEGEEAPERIKVTRLIGREGASQRSSLPVGITLDPEGNRQLTIVVGKFDKFIMTGAED